MDLVTEGRKLADAEREVARQRSRLYPLIDRAIRSGMTKTEVSRLSGVSRVTIDKIIRRAGQGA